MQNNGSKHSGTLTDEQIAFYELEGYLVLPDFLTREDMAPAQEAMEEKVDQIANELFADGLIADRLTSEPFATRLAKLFENLTDKEFLKYGRSWRDRYPGYFKLMSNSKILDAVESLLGPEIFSSPVYNVRPKVPKVAAGTIPWHQDRSYWPDTIAAPIMTVWIPLVDATPENGCLSVIPRTHHRRLLSFHKETYTGTGYTELDEEHIQAPHAEVISLPLAAGGAILFNDKFIHSSTANNSDHVRWSVDLRYQPVDQDPMTRIGLGFLARSRLRPNCVATLEDWLANRPEHVC